MRQIRGIALSALAVVFLPGTATAENLQNVSSWRDVSECEQAPLKALTR